MPENKRKRKPLSIATLLLIIAILSSVTATYAWFSIALVNKLQNMELNVSAGTDLRVDTVSHRPDDPDGIFSYAKTVTNDMIDRQIISNFGFSKSKILLHPLTSGDGITFYLQEENENGGSATEASEGKFIEFNLYFISNNNIWVHLTSADSGSGQPDGTAIIPLDVGKKSNIIRSVRISFQPEGGDAVIYEPNKTTETNIKGQAAKNGITATFDLPGADKMKYTDETRLFYLNSGEEKKVTVRIWAEGEDPECTTAVADGSFLLRMRFIGTDENNVPAE